MEQIVIGTLTCNDTHFTFVATPPPSPDEQEFFDAIDIDEMHDGTPCNCDECLVDQEYYELAFVRSDDEEDVYQIEEEYEDEGWS